MKTAIYGAGATGTALGVLIIKSGGKVDLITRNAAHVAAAKKDGLTLTCAADGIAMHVDAPVFTVEEALLGGEKYDAVFLMTKQRENAKTVEFIRENLLEKDGVVITTQNGLPERGVAKIMGEKRTFGCVCSFGANFEKAGEAVLTSALHATKVCVGAYSREDEAFCAEVTARLKALLQPIDALTGGEFYRETENLLGVRYSKLTLNAAFSGLSVATGMTFGEVAKRKKTKKIAIAIMRETLAVAEAAGVKPDLIQGRNIAAYLKKGGWIKETFLRIALPFFVGTHKRSVSGMLLDLKRGKRCEIDFITGAISAEGALYGVKTPYCDAVTALVHGIEDGLFEIGEENAAFLERPERDLLR